MKITTKVAKNALQASNALGDKFKIGDEVYVKGDKSNRKHKVTYVFADGSVQLDNGGVMSDFKPMFLTRANAASASAVAKNALARNDKWIDDFHVIKTEGKPDPALVDALKRKSAAWKVLKRNLSDKAASEAHSKAEDEARAIAKRLGAKWIQQGAVAKIVMPDFKGNPFFNSVVAANAVCAANANTFDNTPIDRYVRDTICSKFPTSSLEGYTNGAVKYWTRGNGNKTILADKKARPSLEALKAKFEPDYIFTPVDYGRGNTGYTIKPRAHAQRGEFKVANAKAYDRNGHGLKEGDIIDTPKGLAVILQFKQSTSNPERRYASYVGVSYDPEKKVVQEWLMTGSRGGIRATVQNAKFAVTSKSGAFATIDAPNYAAAEKEAKRRFGAGCIVHLIGNSTAKNGSSKDIGGTTVYKHDDGTISYVLGWRNNEGAISGTGDKSRVLAKVDKDIQMLQSKIAELKKVSDYIRGL